MKNDRFRRDADLLLGRLVWTRTDANRVLSVLKGEQPKMKRKMSLGLILACILMLLTAVALATGLIFSPRYDAVRLANEALEARYGITPTMMTVLYHTAPVPDADGNDVLTYRSVEDQWAKQIGVYTVKVRDGKAVAVWSHDDEPRSDGLASPVWGVEQIRLILSDYAAACEATLRDAEPIPMPSPEEIAANQKQRAENAAAAKARAKITLEEARRLALEAIAQVYGLSDSQCAALVTTDDEYDSWYGMENDVPVIHIRYHENADAQYFVSIHVETGVIEDVLYDSGLAGNG